MMLRRTKRVVRAAGVVLSVLAVFFAMNVVGAKMVQVINAKDDGSMLPLSLLLAALGLAFLYFQAKPLFRRFVMAEDLSSIRDHVATNKDNGEDDGAVPPKLEANAK